MKIFSKKRTALFLGIATLVLLVGSSFAHAQGIGQLGIEYGTATGLGTQDIRLTIARIIRVALGLVGIVMVVLIAYGGFLYMTAAGDDEKVEKGKKIMVNSVIGLAIILSSFAIVQFVISRLVSATTGGDGGDGGGVDGGGTEFGLPQGAFYVVGISPVGQIPIRNTAVRIVFSDPIDPRTMNSIKVENDAGSYPGEFKIDPSGKIVEFKPTTPCPDAPEQRCFPEDASVSITIIGEGYGGTSTDFVKRLRDGRNLTCSSFSTPCGGRFTTGRLVDMTPPNVSISFPSTGSSYCVGDEVPVYAQTNDEGGIAYVEFLNSQGNTGYTPDSIDAPRGDTPREFTANRIWSTAGLNPAELYLNESVSARSFDIGDPFSTSAPISVVLRPTQCCNGVQDPGETDVDAGGFCGQGEGAPCTSTSDCGAGLTCVNGTCVAQPVITQVSPLDGQPGTLVTIFGNGFGASQGNGSVIFLGDINNAADDVVALAAACTNPWTNTSIVVSLPGGIQAGPVKVVNNAGLSDTSEDLGSLGVFTPSTRNRPGICEVSPVLGAVGSSFNVRGQSFGGGQGTSVLSLGNRIVSVGAWSDTFLESARVPSIQEGRYVVNVQVGGEISNGVYFTVPPPEDRPTITRVDPTRGGLSSYVTIDGSNFGGTAGSVIFLKGQDIADADVSFPEGCATDFWNDTTITVKVPATYRDDSGILRSGHEIQVVRASDGVRSNTKSFTINDEPPGPSVCALSPNNGPEGTQVVAVGERFGAESGGVKYFNNKDGQLISWSSGEVMSLVPVGAVTGPVTVQNDTGNISNNRNFRVADCRESGCGDGEQCCGGSCIAEGATCTGGPREGSLLWRIATGSLPRVPRVIEQISCGTLTQSPSPFKNTQDACPNAQLGARFSELMDGDTFSSLGVATDTVKLEACGTSAEFDEDNCGEPINSGFILSTWALSSLTGTMLVITPPSLETTTWYRVTLSEDLRSAEGVSLDAAYSWVFRTSAANCVMSKVEVTPHEATIIEQDGKQRYDAMAEAANCNLLRCDTFDWNWRTERNPGFIRVDGPSTCNTLDADPSNDVQNSFAVGLIETGSNPPVQIFAKAATLTTSASGSSVNESREDYGLVRVNFLDPKVVTYWPNCQAACVNAEVGVVFNTAMNPTTINATTITLHHCTEESCRTFDEQITPANVEYLSDYLGEKNVARFTLQAGVNLRPNDFYAVRVSREAKSVSGVNLVGLNDNDLYFRWKFRTKNDSDACDIATVDVSPARETLRVIGARAPFFATPRGTPDECNAAGQPLNSLSYGWSWASTKQQIGELYPMSEVSPRIAPRILPEGLGETTQPLDVMPLLFSATCSNQCLNVGSVANTARCGNGIQEFGEDCDDGGTSEGSDVDGNSVIDISERDGCSSVCLHQGSAQTVSISGSNLLPQSADLPALRDYPSGNSDPNPQRIESSTDTIRGSVSARIHSGTVRNSGNTYGGAGLDTPLAVQESGRTYTLSYFAKNVVSGQTTHVVMSHQNGAGNNSTLTHTVTLTDRWIRYSFTATLDGARSTLYMWSEEPDRTWLIDDIRLFEVSEMTPHGLVATDPAGIIGCGNGVLDLTEECDDGNGDNTDGCSNICLWTGAHPPDVICGNNAVGYGEECDDGNTVSGDGCSEACLFEGSRSGISVCGNGGLREAGEDCDDGNARDGFDANRNGIIEPGERDGCSAHCLNQGSLACTTTRTMNCCGNGGAPEIGEDCDDGNTVSGDGCSSQCLNEGSRLPYAICGDWDATESPELGEDCDPGTNNAPGANQGIDPTQYVTALDGSNNPETNTTEIHAEASSKTGSATLTVLCNCEADSQCNESGGTANACGSGSCCFVRPAVTGVMPTDGETGVVRDRVIGANFDQAMNSGSFLSNFVLWRHLNAGEPCAALGGVGRSITGYTGTFCPESTNLQFEGVGGPTQARLGLTSLLAPNTVYVAEVLGTEGGQSGGVKSLNGAALYGSYRWSFTTGNTSASDGADAVASCLQSGEDLVICLGRYFRVDMNPTKHIFNTNVNNPLDDQSTSPSTSPLFDSIADADKIFSASLFLLTTSTTSSVVSAQEIQPITSDPNPAKNFDWQWVWDIPSSASDVAAIALPLQTESLNGVSRPSHNQTVRSGARNDETILTAGAAITVTAHPQLLGASVQGTSNIINFLCKNPWPSVNNFPFYYGAQNLSFYYCRDAGDPDSVEDDLPELNLPIGFPAVAYDPNTRLADPYTVWIATEAGILDEFLLTVDCSSGSSSCREGDAIGFRVLTNSEHEHPREWFSSQGFIGNPQSVKVDSYEAVREGRTVYINAANIADPSAGIIGNIRVSVDNQTDPTLSFVTLNFSSNQASLASVNFLTQGWTAETDFTRSSHSFSIALPRNITQRFDVYLQTNVEETLRTRAYSDASLVFNTNESRDFTFQVAPLPILSQEPAYTNMYVISHNQDAAQELVNIANQIAENIRFNNNLGIDQEICGSALVCSNNASISCTPANAATVCGAGNTCEYKSCTSDLDCSSLAHPGIPASDLICQANKGKTVRNVKRLSDAVTMYRALAHYKEREGQYPALASGSFIPGMTISSWPSWQATFGNALQTSMPTDPLNRFYNCVAPYNSETCWDNVALRFSCPSGSLVYAYQTQGPQSYQLNIGLEGFFPGASWDPIWTPALEPGTNMDPNSSVDNVVTTSLCGASNPTFGTSTRCGDGIRGGAEACEIGQTEIVSCVIDGRSGFRRDTCKSTGADACLVFVHGNCEAGLCGDGTIQSPELCDDGNLNGRYGRCPIDCGIGSASGVGAHCGDGVLNGSEFCDRGLNESGDANDNGEYGSGCSWDCRSSGPRCGDGVRNGAEVCDGETEVSNNIDVNSDNLVEDTGIALCSSVSIEGITYSRTRSRTCTATCSWTGWSGCERQGTCGNSITESGEQCDDGNTDSTDACVSCRNPRCGDGFVRAGAETCDNGSANGSACTPSYNSSCSYCNSSCSRIVLTGPYCGDGARQSPLEACDNEDFGSASCVGLGYAGGNLQCNATCSSGGGGCLRCYQSPPSNSPDRGVIAVRVLTKVCFQNNSQYCESDSDCTGSDNYCIKRPVYDMPLRLTDTDENGEEHDVISKGSAADYAEPAGTTTGATWAEARRVCLRDIGGVITSNFPCERTGSTWGCPCYRHYTIFQNVFSTSSCIQYRVDIDHTPPVRIDEPFIPRLDPRNGINVPNNINPREYTFEEINASEEVGTFSRGVCADRDNTNTCDETIAPFGFTSPTTLHSTYGVIKKAPDIIAIPPPVR